MGRTRGSLLAALMLTSILASAPASGGPKKSPIAVVALIDAGINPYSSAFRDTSPLAYKHPSTYIPGYPKDTPTLRLSLDIPYEKAVEQDADVWKLVTPGTLYWIPGTRIVGAISFGAGGGNCPVVEPPPANTLQQGCPQTPILDDHGHGTMTASRAGGSPSSLAPAARIVEIEGLGSKGVRWAADQGWIDVQSNSWLSLVPPPFDGLVGSTSEAFEYAATKMLTIAASGNGTAYLAGFAPTPTYLLSTAAPGV
ncbi:MAG: S8/S53 family peptidase, partial [Actinomycetota bacterium]